MKGIIHQPGRGRPNKVTKPTIAPRGRPGRRVGPNDSLANELEQHIVSADEGHDHDHNHNHDHVHDHDHDQHAAFDPDAAVAAAAAAQHHHQQQLDLTAASILASSVQNPVDQHHGLDTSHLEDNTGGVHTTEDLAEQSGYQNVTVESALAKRLAREPGMRLAQQRRPDQVLNLARRSNVEALFAHIAGEEAPQPCKNCHKGHGPWTSCVIVDGQMCGSCANCWFNASGARCSFHEARNPQAHGASMLGGENLAFQMPSVSAAAMAPFTYASAPASGDPIVRYTIEQAMAQIRAADKKARRMLMIDAASRQLAYQVVLYEEALREEQNQAAGGPQGPHQSVMNDQDGP
ncbi:guanine nucleotide-binding protein subunit alpha [Hypoxylon texense]